jgi:hypothetical protein
MPSSANSTASVFDRPIRPCLAAALGLGAQELDLFGLAEGVENDVGALGGQAARDAQADTAGGAGDDGDFVLKHVMSVVKLDGR